MHHHVFLDPATLVTAVEEYVSQQLPVTSIPRSGWGWVTWYRRTDPASAAGDVIVLTEVGIHPYAAGSWRSSTFEQWLELLARHDLWWITPRTRGVRVFFEPPALVSDDPVRTRYARFLTPPASALEIVLKEPESLTNHGLTLIDVDHIERVVPGATSSITVEPREISPMVEQAATALDTQRPEWAKIVLTPSGYPEAPRDVIRSDLQRPMRAMRGDALWPRSVNGPTTYGDLGL